MSKLRTINGAWDESENAWVSEILELTGDSYLEVTLPGKGIVVVKKSETKDGPWPTASVTGWSGPEFKITIYGSTEHRFVKVFTTDTPKLIQLVNINKIKI